MKYTRIDIKTKDDLPKKIGRYIVHIKEYDSMRDFAYYDTKVSVKLWMNDIDWYLIEDTEPSYPEEFVRWCIDNVDNDDRDDLGYKYSILDDNGGDYKTFPDMDKVFEYWLNEIKNK